MKDVKVWPSAPSSHAAGGAARLAAPCTAALLALSACAMLLLMPACAALAGQSYEGGEQTSFALNDYTRLGQTFTAPSQFNILYLTAPSWSDSEGGFTLSLYDSPRRKKLWARQAYSNFPDNSLLYMYIPATPGPGTYYWEISDRTGKTKVGLYAHRNSTYAGGCAYFNGVADKSLDFLSSWRYSPYVGHLRRLSLTERKAQASGKDETRKRLPQWIWYPDPTFYDNCTRYFRFTFDLPAAARKADLLIAADDGYDVYVGGRHLGSGGWEWAKSFDIAKIVHRGRNVLAARVSNAVAPAGLIVMLRVTTADGRALRFTSNMGPGWRSFDKEVAGWEKPGFDASAWKRCVSTGDALSDPWFSHGNVRLFSQGLFDEHKILAALEGEPPAHAQAKYEHGAMRLVINGKTQAPFLFSSVGLSDMAPDFSAIGCHLFQPRYNLADIWVGPGRYDFSGWDLHLARLLYDDPKAYFDIMIGLAPPRWWMDQHQDQLVRYADGTGFISDQWGGTMQASFASDKWRDDATAALRALLRHFDASPLRSRIIMYHLGNGIYGEWHYFDACHLPDTSAPFTAAFQRWAKGFYRNTAALSRAWGRPIDRFDDIRAPNVAERTHLDCDLLRDPAQSRYVSDYYRFLHTLGAKTLLHFAQVVKEETHRRVLCGAYNCYMLENLWIQEGGHLEGPRVLRSPDLDYISNPYSYQGAAYDDAGNYLGSARGVGGDGAYRVPVESVRLHHKLYFSETDTSTWLEYNPELTQYGGEGTDTPAGTRRALRRDFGQALGEGVGTWLLELAPGWYADPKIMAELKWLRGLLAEGTTRDMSRVSQVAGVCDPESFFYSSHWKDAEAGDYDLFDAYFMDTENRALHRISAPVDFLYLNDLLRAPRYKLYVFLNAFYLTDADIAAIKRKVCHGGATVVWLYAPGFVSPTRLSAARMGDLMGMKVKRFDTPGPLMIDVTDHKDPITKGAETRFGLSRPHWPRFAVVDPAATKLGVWEGTHKCGFAVRRFPDWTSVYVGAGPVPIGLLRNLAAAAGVHIYSSRRDIVYANASYLVLVANGKGRRVVRLRVPMRRLRDDGPAGPVERGDVTVDMQHGDVVFWQRAGR